MIPTPWEPQPGQDVVGQGGTDEYIGDINETFQKHLSDFYNKKDTSEQPAEDYIYFVKDKKHKIEDHFIIDDTESKPQVYRNDERHQIINLSDDFKLQSIGKFDINSIKQM